MSPKCLACGEEMFGPFLGSTDYLTFPGTHLWSLEVYQCVCGESEISIPDSPQLDTLLAETGARHVRWHEGQWLVHTFDEVQSKVFIPQSDWPENPAWLSQALSWFMRKHVESQIRDALHHKGVKALWVAVNDPVFERNEIRIAWGCEYRTHDHADSTWVEEVEKFTLGQVLRLAMNGDLS